MNFTLMHIVRERPARAGATEPLVITNANAVATVIIDDDKSSLTPTHLMELSNKNVAVLVTSISFVELEYKMI